MNWGWKAALTNKQSAHPSLQDQEYMSVTGNKKEATTEGITEVTAI